jgi:hypothetical protein
MYMIFDWRGYWLEAGTVREGRDLVDSSSEASEVCEASRELKELSEYTGLISRRHRLSSMRSIR